MGWLRLAVVAAGVVGLVGCGGVAARSAAANGVVLSDAASGMQYELSVADGALVLTGMGSSGAASDPALTDAVTGAGYRVGVANGSLTLEPGGSGTLEPGAAGVNEIGLVDTVTAKTFDLAVAGGSLTLIAQDGGGQ